MGMIRVVRCLDAERVAYGGIEAGRIFFCTDTNIAWIGTAGGDLSLGSGSFLGLTDTPASFVGETLKHVRVNVGETALEFVDPHTVGDWTPAITFGGAAVGATYGANNAGRYIRIGDWVTLTGRLQLTSKGTSNGAVLITPLPFTAANEDGAWTPVNARLNKISFADQWTLFIAANTADITVGEQTMAGVYTDLTDADFANDSVVTINVTYEVQ